MARIRLSVVLIVPAPVRNEIDGLRRALGDSAFDRVPAHLTLVPPVNVRTEALPTALAILRRAAAAAPRSLNLHLGPVATFWPASPVLYLGVGGDLDALHQLRNRVFSGPLERALTWPFVPHVTLSDHAGPDGIAAAVATLAHFHISVAVEGVHILREDGHGEDRRWVPIADARFGPAAIIGRGGLALELVRSEGFDPEVEAMLSDEGREATRPACGERRPIVVTARREGEVVGVGAAWITDDGAQVAVLTASGQRGQGIGSHLLAAVESAVREAGWTSRQLGAIGPPEFYAARSGWASVQDYSKTMDE